MQRPLTSLPIGTELPYELQNLLFRRLQQCVLATAGDRHPATVAARREALSVLRQVVVGIDHADLTLPLPVRPTLYGSQYSDLEDVISP